MPSRSRPNNATLSLDISMQGKNMDWNLTWAAANGISAALLAAGTTLVTLAALFAIERLC